MSDLSSLVSGSDDVALLDVGSGARDDESVGQDSAIAIDIAAEITI